MWKNQGKTGQEFLKNAKKDESVMINSFDAASKLLNLGTEQTAREY